MYMARDSKFYHNAEFRALNATWKRKLKASGFVDLENSDSPDEPLITNIDKRTKRFRGVTEILIYFDIALEFLHHGQFDSRTQKAIWGRHAYGHSIQEKAAA